MEWSNPWHLVVDHPQGPPVLDAGPRHQRLLCHQVCNSGGVMAIQHCRVSEQNTATTLPGPGLSCETAAGLQPEPQSPGPLGIAALVCGTGLAFPLAGGNSAKSTYCPACKIHVLSCLDSVNHLPWDGCQACPYAHHPPGSASDTVSLPNPAAAL